MVDGIHVGFLFFSFYGLLISFGALAGAFLAQHEAKRRGYDSAHLWDMLIWLLIGGILGARLWHVFTPSPSAIADGLTTQYYLSHPLALLDTRKGGMGIPGAVIAGALVLYVYTRKNRLSFLAWADIIVPGLALGQAIGRWGNFVNQELYGAPSSLPWAIFIDPAHRLAGFADQAYYHPLFLYESLWNLGNMVLLLWLGRRFSKTLKDGDLLWVYLLVYPLGRFLLDFLRLDASQLGGFNANQSLMALVTVLSFLTFLWGHRKHKVT